MKEICMDSEFAEKVNELQNKVAELEEEKGNLQLKLFELEDPQTSSKPSELEIQLKKEKDLLNEQITLTRDLQDEKRELETGEKIQ